MKNLDKIISDKLWKLLENKVVSKYDFDIEVTKILDEATKMYIDKHLKETNLFTNENLKLDNK